MSNTKIPSVLWNTDQSGVLSSDDITRAKANIGLATAVVLKGSATVAQLNSMTQDGEHVIESGLATGWQFTMSDSGTLRAGSLVVSAGDKVVWNGEVYPWCWEMAGGGGKIKIYRVTKADGDEWNWPDEDEVSQLVRAGTYPILVLQPGQDYEALHAYTFEKSESVGSYRYMYFSCLEENKVIVSTYRLGYSPYWNIVSAPKVNDTAIAPEYSSSNTYTNSELCMREGKLYACTVIGGITTPEEWNSNHWVETQLTSQVAMSNVAIFQWDPYQSPPDQTFCANVVAAVNAHKEVIVYQQVSQGPILFYRYADSGREYNPYRYRYTFYQASNLNKLFYIDEYTDSTTGEKSYGCGSYTSVQYLTPHYITLNSTASSEYEIYTPNDLAFSDTQTLLCCIEQTIAGDPYDSTKWKATNIDTELKSRAYIIHAKYDSSKNIIGPTREEMDNINTKGVVIFDIECYTGGINPDTGKQYGPIIHDKYIMFDSISRDDNSEYQGDNVYKFHSLGTWTYTAPKYVSIAVPKTAGSAPVVTFNEPEHDVFTYDMNPGQSSYPDSTTLHAQYRVGSLPIIYNKTTTSGDMYYPIYRDPTSVSAGKFQTIPNIDGTGHYHQWNLRYSSLGQWTHSSDTNSENAYLDYKYYTFPTTNEPSTYQNSHLIFARPSSSTLPRNIISLSRVLSGKMYTVHCMCAGQRLALRNDTATPSIMVYDNSFTLNSGGHPVSASPYALNTGAELELWTSENTHGVTANFLYVNAAGKLYVSYGY